MDQSEIDSPVEVTSVHVKEGQLISEGGTDEVRLLHALAVAIARR
jgi:hypothetical protein